MNAMTISKAARKAGVGLGIDEGKQAKQRVDAKAKLTAAQDETQAALIVDLIEPVPTL